MLVADCVGWLFRLLIGLVVNCVGCQLCCLLIVLFVDCVGC